MLQKQKDAVDKNLVDLTEAVKPNFLVFLDYLASRGTITCDERDLVESKVTRAGKLEHLFRMLKTKDPGWVEVLSYLREHHQATLADKLQKDAGAAAADADYIHKPTATDEFAARLAEYYIRYYSNVPTMGEFPKHVKDVWVPLKIDGRQQSYTPAHSIDHVDLCNRLKYSEGSNVALVKGDPGMGKTTLSKKIAYDWAINYGSSNAQQFVLVLAVPLRYVGKSNPIRFDHLAIDYFFSILDVEEIDKAELIRDIRGLKSQLLVILDGLDEYSGYAESSFRFMFEAPFQLHSISSNVHPPAISFKLIVTSRPYACERVNEEFWPLRFAILPLDANHLNEFVNLYCQTSHGIVKVTAYLKVNASLVIKVPLILTFVCYLADSQDEIPTNMTSLYDNLTRQMLVRENRQGKLAEPINIQKWKDSNVVKSTAELAFSEIHKGLHGNFEFTKVSLDKCHVTNDSFICGFLLHKFDFAKDLLKAEFPHRSIQEFFVALHCYQLTLSGSEDELSGICTLILRDDSQFGRFLFGICSLEGRFVQMTNWLNPLLSDSADILWSLAREINRFGTNLRDCTDDENILIGQMLLESIEHLDERVTTHIDIPYVSFYPQLHNCSDEFINALHIIDLTRDPTANTTDWLVVDNRQSALFTVVSSKLTKLLERKFDRINILIWNASVGRTSGMEWKTIFSLIRSLPPVRTLIMRTMEKTYLSTYTTVFVRIVYGRMSRSELKNLRFGYNNKQRKELQEAIPDEQSVKLTEIKRGNEIDSGMRSFININVTVDRCESQSALIFSLIRLSLL